MGGKRPLSQIDGSAGADLGGGVVENFGIKNAYYPVVTVSAAGTTETVDLAGAPFYEITLDENVTISFSNPPASGKAGVVTLILKQDGTGTNTVSWGDTILWAGGSAPTITATGNAVDVLFLFTIDGGSAWYGFVCGQDMS